MAHILLVAVPLFFSKGAIASGGGVPIKTHPPWGGGGANHPFIKQADWCFKRSIFLIINRVLVLFLFCLLGLYFNLLLPHSLKYRTLRIPQPDEKGDAPQLI